MILWSCKHSWARLRLYRYRSLIARIIIPSPHCGRLFPIQRPLHMLLKANLNRLIDIKQYHKLYIAQGNPQFHQNSHKK